MLASFELHSFLTPTPDDKEAIKTVVASALDVSSDFLVDFSLRYNPDAINAPVGLERHRYGRRLFSKKDKVKGKSKDEEKSTDASISSAQSSFLWQCSFSLFTEPAAVDDGEDYDCPSFVESALSSEDFAMRIKVSCGATFDLSSLAIQAPINSKVFESDIKGSTNDNDTENEAERDGSFKSGDSNEIGIIGASYVTSHEANF